LLHLDSNQQLTEKQQAVPQTAVAPLGKEFFYRVYSFDITRVFDIIISLLTLILLLPLLLLIALIVKISSTGPVIYAQQRVGKDDEEFTLYKFRTMHVHTAENRSLTVGSDKRITKFGSFLRRYKLDEFPQLFNVLKNDMSIVGPRPELRKYVNYYNTAQREILFVKPGITDYASILFRKENELLASQYDFEQYYIQKVIPLKIKLNAKYKNDKSLKTYFIIIIKTFLAIFK
jgi:lipopolysaccharide/colanic/teichoic acid biosynthesis glycosyltransferase